MPPTSGVVIFGGRHVTIATHHRNRFHTIARAALLSASVAALCIATGTTETHAQSAQGAGAAALPPIRITAPEAKRRSNTRPARQADRSAARRRTARTARNPAPAAPTPSRLTAQDARTGTVGVYANSTAVATKSNTALVNIPQSLTVVTKDFIRDQNYQNLTDVARYVPGVAVHQGEGNRDELVIRGVDSSANFFVNGFRDDAQIFRDIYNTESIEVLRGPSALTFGRSSGGGILNRTLKEADGQRIYEAGLQTGSFGDRRVTLDAGQGQRERRRAVQRILRRRRRLPRLHPSRALRHQPDGDADA